MYVFHLPAIGLSSFVVSNKFAQIAVAFAATFIASVISYEFMEKKLIGLKDYYFGHEVGQSRAKPVQYSEIAPQTGPQPPTI